MSASKHFQEVYPSPLSVYEGQPLPELPTGVTVDGKSLDNGVRGYKSEAYQRHPAPIQPLEQGNAFDFHGMSFYSPSTRIYEWLVLA